MRKLFLLVFALCVWSVFADAQEGAGRYIEVTGSSEIEVVPDEIHFLIQIKEYWQESSFRNPSRRIIKQRFHWNGLRRIYGGF